MAMAVRKAKEPSVPRGGGYRGKANAPKDTRPLASAVGKVVTLESVRSTVPWYEDLPVKQYSKPTPRPASGSTGGTGGGDKEWMPVWNWDYGKASGPMYALLNLLMNAELFTPCGRHFKPDPNHDGESLVSPPQRTALNCAVEWDNVVDFDMALEQARREAISKSANSQQARGGSFDEPQLVKEYVKPKHNTKAKDGQHQARKKDEVVSASRQEAANQDTSEQGPRTVTNPKDVVLNRLLAEGKYVLSGDLFVVKLADFNLVNAYLEYGDSHRMVTYPMDTFARKLDKLEGRWRGESHPWITDLEVNFFFPELYKGVPIVSADYDLDNELTPWDIDDEPWLSESFNSGVSTSDASDMASIDEQFLTDLLGVQHMVAMAFDDNEVYALSPSSKVAAINHEIWLNFYIEDCEYHYTQRFDGATFYSILETAFDRFSIHDRNHVLIDDTMLTDWAVNELFNCKSVGGEFNAFSYVQLLGLWYSAESKKMMILSDCPFKQYPYVSDHQPPKADYLEMWKWEHEYQVGMLAFKHRDYLRSMAFDALNPGLPELPVQQQAQQHHALDVPVVKQRDDYVKYMAYWVRGDDESRYQRWLCKRAGLNERSVAERTGPDLYGVHRTIAFLSSVPVIEQVVIPHREPLLKKVRGKLRGWANRFKSWMSEPVFEPGWAKDVALSPIPDSFEKEIDRAVVKQITERVIREKTAHDDAYDIEWLESLTDQKIDRNKPYDPLAMAIKAVQDDTPKDVMSESGIYLGKEVMIPRTKMDLVIIGNTEGVDTTCRVSSSTLDPTKVGDLGKDRLAIPLKK